MDIHIDWLSFTLETAHDPASHMDLLLLAKSLIKEQGNELFKIIFNGTSHEPVLSRTPYRLCIQREDHGCRIYGSSHTNTILVELSGRGCEDIRDRQLEIEVITAVHSRITRLDIACDIRSSTLPVEFTNTRSHKAFRSVSYISSDTGTTCYIGSPKSDRFCRCYRYNPPHPRADLLRVEYVFRKHLARAACSHLLEHKDLSNFASALGNTWGFAHQDWQPAIQSDERVRTPVLTREQEDTIAWLYKQVAPAVAKLLTSTSFDVTDWLEHIYSKVPPPLE